MRGSAPGLRGLRRGFGRPSRLRVWRMRPRCVTHASGWARVADALARSQEELYSYVTVVDTPEGFANLGTKTVETA